MNKELEKRIKRKKGIRILRIVMIVVCLFIYLTLAFIHKNDLTIKIILGIVFSIVLLALEIYANSMSLKEELFVEDLLAMSKRKMEDEEIKEFLVKKYGADLYNTIIGADSRT